MFSVLQGDVQYNKSKDMYPAVDIRVLANHKVSIPVTGASKPIEPRKDM